MNPLRGFFVLLMFAAGTGKLLDMSGFYPVVASYRLLPEVLVIPSAWALTLGELLLAVWLVWGRWLKWAALAVIAMHLFYLLGVSQALLRGLELDNCGCFGVYLARPLRWYTPLEDLALLVLSGWFWVLSKRGA